jgi:glucose/arabinose dehydrogenase
MNITRRHILLAGMLLLLSACGSPATSTTTAVPDAIPTAVPDTSPTPVPAIDDDVEEVATATAEPDGPVLLRDDMQIRKVVDTGGAFIRLVQDPLTEAILALNSQAEIFQITVQPDAPSRSELLYSADDIGGSAATTGLGVGPDGSLYVVSNEDRGSLTRAIIRKGTPDGSGGRTWTTLATTEQFPKSGTQYDHQVNGIVASPDGAYVYVNSGSRTEHGEVQSNEGAHPDTREVPLTSAIFRIPTDGTDLVLPADEAQLKEQGYLFADGLRNSYDLAFAPNGDLFATENGPDADMPDELNWIREGRHYGFPWRFGTEPNPQTDPNYDPAQDRRLNDEFLSIKEGMYAADPEFPPAPTEFTDPVANTGPDADKYTDMEGNEQDASDRGEPIHTFTPHRSPLGLSFDTAGALSEFKNDAFVLSWGWGIPDPTLADPGQDLLHLDLAKEGDAYTASVTQIARDFDHPIDSLLIGDKLYVLDWGGKGTLWEITLP